MTTFESITSSFADWSGDATTAIPWVPESVMWLLVVGFIVGFILSFAVGANDVANSFGTVVGAKVLTMRQACILATIFETTGAILLGAKVGETIRKGIIDISVYEFEGGAKILMMGEVAAMFGSGLWQIIATIFKLPVSGTHSIVGACIGFSLVAVGSNGVNWADLGFIVASWFISPVLCGLASVAMYYLVQRYIINAANPLKNGLKILPVFYAITIGINAFSILFSGAPLLGITNLPVWGILLITLGCMICVAIASQMLAVPRVRAAGRKLMNQQQSDIAEVESCSSKSLHSSNEETKNSTQKTSNPLTNLTGTTKKVKFGKSSVAASPREKREDWRFEKGLENISELETDTSSQVTTNAGYSKGAEPFIVQLTSCSESEFSTTENETDDSKKSLQIRVNKKREDSEKARQAKIKEAEAEADEDEDPATIREVFSALQVLTACFAGFAHGGNDVSNAIGPLVALWIIFGTGEVVQEAPTPWYILLYGGFGITVGLWLLGRRVIRTIGNDLIKVTPSKGFCIELMTAVTVLVASNIGIPISTTHCKVGAVVSIGWYRSRSAVEWSLVRNIGCAWFVTLPLAGLFSAGAMYLLMMLF